MIKFYSCLFYLSLATALFGHNNLKIGAEWLYWKVEQSQLEIGTNLVKTQSNTIVNGSTFLPNFNCSNGYRMYADYLCSKDWTITAALTHLDSQPKASLSNDPALIDTNFFTFNNVLFPIFSLSPALLSNVELGWKINIYYLDAYIARTFCICPSIQIDPYVGGRGFWMKQRICLNGDSPNDQGGPLTLIANFSEQFCGGGLLGGIKAYWILKWRFFFVANLGGSLIYSDVNDRFTIHSRQSGETLQVLNTNSSHKLHPGLDSLLGLMYRYPS